MITFSVPYNIIETQELSGNDGEVFCPMCEVWHQNNTFCQMSGND